VAKGDDNISKPRYTWWGHAINMVKAYPDRCRELKDAKEQIITANYSGYTGHSGVSKPVETLALRQLSKNDQKEMDAVKNALDEIKRSQSGDLKVKLIEMVYFKNPRRIKYAVLKLPIEYDTAKLWHREFIRLVGKHYGFFD